MEIQKIDLYAHFEQERPVGAVGSLTCWLPDYRTAINGDRALPAVLVLPGGGYTGVSHRESESIALGFGARGFAAFVLDYAVAPARFPTALREAAMAMVYIRKNARNLGVDPRKVAAMGFSAGGHLCGTLGTMYDSAFVADIASGEMIRPDALGLNYPVAVSWGRTHEGSFRNLTGTDDKTQWDKLSVDKLVRPDMPPVFLWHTRDDEGVPCRNSLQVAVALEAQGVDFVLHIYRHGIHGLSVANETVYRSDALPVCSWDIPGWFDAQVRFFADCGLKIED